MAVKMQSRTYSKKLIFKLITVVMLAWLILLGWAMSLWMRLGFETAQHRLEQLYSRQRAAISFDVPRLVRGIHGFRSGTRFPDPADEPRDVGIANKIQAISNALPDPNSEFMQLANDGLQTAEQLWQLVVLTSQIILIKLTILLAAIPLFLLTMTAGLIDGLNQRAIRTASLGRESSYVFHQLNRLFKRLLVVLLGLWLVIPVSITPAVMLIPVSLLLSVMVSVTASRFKKYL